MRRAWSAAALLWVATSASAELPLCGARLVLEPSAGFVGQPVLHRVQIERRRDVVDLRWEVSPSFPAFRAEWIPSRTGPGTSEGATLEEERRVLFPARSGALTLPAAQLVCESAGRVQRVSLPASEFVAQEPPVAGRPAGWQGLIGPVEVRLRVTPDRVALGESASVAVVVEGETNVWAAPPPFAGVFRADEAELFDRPAELARDSGRRLALRRYFGFDLVPRRAGTLTVPEVRVPYFDPATGRYDVARAPAVTLRVTGSPTAAVVGEPEAAQAAPAPGPPRSGARWALLLAGAGTLGAIAWAWRRRHGPARPAGGAAGLERLRQALAEGEPDEAAAAAARALRDALETTVPGARGRAVEELATAASDRDSRDHVALLARLEAARFDAGDAEALLALAREAEVRLRDR